MKSEVKVYERGNGEIQRVQVVRWDDWSQLDFLSLKQETQEQQVAALKCFYDIYKNFLIPSCPWIFPQMVMFTLPEDDEMYDVLVDCAKAGMQVGEHIYYKSEKYGNVTDPLTIATILLQEGVKLKKGKPVFANKEAESLYRELEKRGCAHIVCGKFPSTKMIPVGRNTGYLSQAEKDAKIKANAHFFIMDPFDCATVYDQVGTPFGLCVKDGVVENPPLFGREALLVKKDGTVSISEMDVKELKIEINGTIYTHGENATIYTRPERTKAPVTDGTCLAIVGNRVVAIKEGGPAEIPASGFVLRVDPDSFIKPRTLENGQKMKTCVFCDVPTGYVDAKPGDEVIYRGLEDIQFGIQVGNSIVRDDEKTTQFISCFYNIYHLERVAFPPSLYPMDFENARAARMALGADGEGRPVLFWAEGKGKLEYVPGRDSTGASLTEMAEIALDLGLRNAVNLDGGGSAQIMLDGMRALRISDRNTEDNSDAERLVPLGLVVK